MGLLDRLLPARTPTSRRAVVAAARQIRMRDSKPPVPNRAGWQTRAYAVRDAVGEVHAAFDLFANGLSKVEVFPAWKAYDDSDPIPLWDVAALDDPAAVKPPPSLVAAALAVWERLEDGEGGLSNQGGVSGLVSESALHIGLVGECNLYVPDDPARSPEVLSISELAAGQGGTWEIRRSPTVKRGDPVDVDNDLLLRVWRPHPQWSDVADSSLRPILDTGEFLRLAEQGDLAIARSRIANAGILAVDSSLDFVRSNGDEPGDEHEPTPFSEEFVAEGIAAITDPSSAAAVMPIVVEVDTGDGTIAEKIQHVPIPRSLDSETRERVVLALRRLALSVDLPPELLLGKENLNHWTAWQVDESTFKAHLEPTLLLITGAFAGGFLRPALADGYDPRVLRRLVAGYDATDLLIRPDRTADAKWAHDALLISDAAAARELGFSDADFPDEDEIERRLTYKAAITIAVKTGQIPDIGEMLDPARRNDDDESGPAAPLPDTAPAGGDGAPEDDTVAASVEVVSIERDPTVVDLRRRVAEARVRELVASAATPTPLDRLAATLDAIDAELYAKVEGAVDTSMRRVLERAGNRLRSKARKDESLTAAISGVDAADVAATLGPKIVRSLVAAGEAELVEDGFDDLEGRFDQWVAAAQGAALAAALDFRTSDAIDPDALAAEQAADREEAWRWFRDALVGAALATLFGPDVDPEGEVDPNVRVPFQTIREALARAGGAGQATAAGLASRARDAKVLFRARGVATGVRIVSMLSTLGVQERGLVWIYGTAPRVSFEPHRALDGQTFSGPDDDGLATSGGFPYVDRYYPGDHRGCRCRWQAVLIDVSGTPDVSAN